MTVTKQRYFWHHLPDVLNGDEHHLPDVLNGDRHHLPHVLNGDGHHLPHVFNGDGHHPPYHYGQTKIQPLRLDTTGFLIDSFLL